MKRAVRGSTVTLIATNFLDRDGAATTPAAVTAYLDYPTGNRCRAQSNYAMTENSGEWTYDWDSSIAAPGTVFWSVRAEGDDNFAEDDQFQLTANIANPDP